ncbi:hypothetical protein ACFQU7_38120 [Pseudoroseomonas wenyumeiae]
MLLRARRRAALGSEATMLLEQAALAAAIDALRDLYLPDLSNPFSSWPRTASRCCKRPTAPGCCRCCRTAILIWLAP